MIYLALSFFFNQNTERSLLLAKLNTPAARCSNHKHPFFETSIHFCHLIDLRRKVAQGADPLGK
ncbi:hypothetical protein ACE6H2_016514 [Prunus campanulata]